MFEGDYCQDTWMPEGFLLLIGLVRHFSSFQVGRRKTIYGCSSFLCLQSPCCFLRHKIQCSSCRLTSEQDVCSNCDSAICSGHAWLLKEERLSFDALSWLIGCLFADRDAREFAHRAIEEPRRSLRLCPALGSSMFQGEFGELQAGTSCSTQ